MVRRAVRAPRRLPRDTWQPPLPLGYAASIQGLGGFAAPLLAGASFTMAALLLPTLAAAQPRFARWPDAAVSLFIASGLAQIGAVQAAVWARRYDTLPEELAQWWPGEMRDGRPTRWLRNVQRGHATLSLRWADRTRGFYHAGIVLLLSGTLVVGVPPGRVPGPRWTLIGTAAVGLVGELAWLVHAAFFDPARRRAAHGHAAAGVAGLVAASASLPSVGGTGRAVAGAVLAGAAAGHAVVTARAVREVWAGCVVRGRGLGALLRRVVRGGASGAPVRRVVRGTGSGASLRRVVRGTRSGAPPRRAVRGTTSGASPSVWPTVAFATGAAVLAAGAGLLLTTDSTPARAAVATSAALVAGAHLARFVRLVLAERAEDGEQ
ncbi:hypothetical protein [Streptomyces alboflavus]|uniref:hypothetical protein n=1 Tax=Streptomyces alboflavus TaxID=67267 RepID=UPI0004C186C8|nr:hypothetical protein [Streptomyces alboflavus]